MSAFQPAEACVKSQLIWLAHVELPASLLNPPPTAGSSTASGSASQPTPTSGATLRKEAKKKHHLTITTDPLLNELRDLNFSSIGKKLNTLARRLDEDYKVQGRQISRIVIIINKA